MTYISRAELLQAIELLREDLEEGGSKKSAIKKLKALEYQGRIAYTKRVNSEEIAQLLRIVEKNPGIKYKDLAARMGRSNNWVKSLSKASEAIEERVLEDQKGAYGKKPFGLWIKDTDED